MLKLRSLLLFVIIFTSTVASANSPNIMVSIKPFYNICARVMQSVGSPNLLLKNNASPHDYQLRPSEAKFIDSSDLIIWGGPDLESYLQKPINSLANRDLNLATIPGLTLLPLRTSSDWHSHDHEHGHHHAHAVHDSHFWLDPQNAIIIATAIAQRLGEIDPTHAKIYADNATAFAKEINQKIKVWQQKLNPYQDKPYIALHDAYQYFNKYFELDGAGSITLNPEVPPSTKRIKQIQSILVSKGVTCIFSEPQFNYKIIDMLIAGTNVHKGELDPLGQDKDAGPNGYIILIDNLVQSFVQCNAQKNG